MTEDGYIDGYIHDGYSEEKYEFHSSDYVKKKSTKQSISKPIVKSKTKGITIDTAKTGTFDFSMIGRVFGLVITIILVVMFVRVLQGGRPPTFESLLNTLANAPTNLLNKIDLLLIPVGTLPDWLSWLEGLWNILTYMLKGIVALMQYCIYFLQWIFG